jgi:subtilisin family serine protease
MKKWIALIICVLLCSCLLQANARLGDKTDKPLFAPDMVKVQLTAEAIRLTDLPQEMYAEAPSFGIPELDRLTASLHSKSVMRIHRRLNDKAWEQKSGFDRWFIVKVPKGTDILKAVDLFKASKYIEHANPEFFQYTQFVPNDTYYANNWGHNNTVQFPKYNTSTGTHDGVHVGLNSFDSNAQICWDLGQFVGSANVVIGIIDTGVDVVHPDLRLCAGYDFGSNDSDPADNVGHGTCCAGIAAARSNNGYGVAGIAGGCTVMPLKVANSSGLMYQYAIENALTYAADHGVDVVSMSLGNDTSQGDDTGFDQSMQYAYDQGVPMFAAAGNDNHYGVCYPAGNTNVICVGAASPSGERKDNVSSDGEYWWGSNWGYNAVNNRAAVDIMGPTILPTTDRAGPAGYTDDGYDLWFNGTSCATPYVAGVAALMKSKNPALTPANIKSVLETTAIDMTIGAGAVQGWDQYTGYGFVNAYYAVYFVSAGAPSCRITSPTTGKGYTIGTTINVNVTALDFGGSITKVDYYIDSATTPSYTDVSYPYSWSWDTTGLSWGSHIIKAIATDNSSTTSFNAVTVYLLNEATDGFEATFMTTMPWVQTGDVDWFQQSDQSLSGTKSAKSGSMDAINYNSTMAFTVNITSGGILSFWRKVVSETGTDSLKFYIDDIRKMAWTNYNSWQYYSITVTSGVHEFKWSYVNQGVTNHLGCAYIDHLTLPAYSTSTQPNMTWSPNSFTENLEMGYFDYQNLIISNWNSPPVTFTAHFPYATTTLLDETFATTTIPSGWTQQIVSGTANWVFATGGYRASHPSTAYDGTYNARLFNGTTTAMTTRLITPVLNFTGAASGSLSFWHTQEAWATHGQDALGVYYRTSSTGTWTLLETYTTSIAEWTREVISLPNINSTYYICFGGAVQYGYGICIDKVVVTMQSGNATPWVQINYSNSVTATISNMSIYTYPISFSPYVVPPGTYTTSLIIESNCYMHPYVVIPITFNLYPAGPPGAPLNIAIVEDEANDVIRLNWSIPSGFPNSYNIYRATSADFSDGVLIGNIPSNQTQFTDPLDHNRRKVFYKVTSVRE